MNRFDPRQSEREKEIIHMAKQFRFKADPKQMMRLLKKDVSNHSKEPPKEEEKKKKSPVAPVKEKPVVNELKRQDSANIGIDVLESPTGKSLSREIERKLNISETRVPHISMFHKNKTAISRLLISLPQPEPNPNPLQNIPERERERCNS